MTIPRPLGPDAPRYVFMPFLLEKEVGAIRELGWHLGQCSWEEEGRVSKPVQILSLEDAPTLLLPVRRNTLRARGWLRTGHPRASVLNQGCSVPNLEGWQETLMNIVCYKNLFQQ